MLGKVTTACGMGSVNVTTGEISQRLRPLTLAEEMVFRYNITCLGDEFLSNGICRDYELMVADIYGPEDFTKNSLWI